MCTPVQKRRKHERPYAVCASSVTTLRVLKLHRFQACLHSSSWSLLQRRAEPEWLWSSVRGQLLSAEKAPNKILSCSTDSRSLLPGGFSYNIASSKCSCTGSKHACTAVRGHCPSAAPSLNGFGALFEASSCQQRKPPQKRAAVRTLSLCFQADAFCSQKHGETCSKASTTQRTSQKDAIQFSDDRCRDLVVWSCWLGAGWMFFGSEKHCKRWTNAEV